MTVSQTIDPDAYPRYRPFRLKVGDHELTELTPGLYFVSGPDTGIPDAILDALPADACVTDWQFVGDTLYTYFA